MATYTYTAWIVLEDGSKRQMGGTIEAPEYDAATCWAAGRVQDAIIRECGQPGEITDIAATLASDQGFRS